MLRKILYFLLISFFFVSCLVTPPSDSSGKTEYKSNLRNIEVVCTEDTHCKNNSASSFEVVAMYTTDECNDVDLSSPIIGISREDLQCDSSECSAFVKSFKEDSGIEDVNKTIEGIYTLAVFVDVNNNEFPDKNEPFYCNADVVISTARRLTNIKVEVVRKLDI